MANSLAESGIDQEILRLEGIIQRVDYRRRELKVVADGKVLHFVVPPDSRLWFDHQQAILRCFHPLDRVHIEYAETTSGPRILAMHGWEKFPSR